MTIFSVDLKNCYGIPSLKHDFDFDSGNVYLIYASNGTMKTSFLKTFEQLSLGEKPKDEIYPFKITSFIIKKGKTDLQSNEIFTIKNYIPNYRANNCSQLVISDKLKRRYMAELEIISNEGKIIIDSFKESCQKIIDLDNFMIPDDQRYLQGSINSLIGDMEKTLLQDPEFLLLFFLQYKSKNCTFYGIQNYQNGSILRDFAFEVDIDFLSYTLLFNDDMQEFCNNVNPLLSEKLEYIKEAVYDGKMTLKPIHLGTGTYSINIQQNQNDLINDIFSLIKEPNNKGINKFLNYYNNESSFLNEQNTQKFSKKEILMFLYCLTTDYFEFKKQIWLRFFATFMNEYDFRINLENISEKIDQIKVEAKSEETNWHNVAQIFNSRFHLPFSITIPNQSDVILRERIPQFIFSYSDSEMEYNQSFVEKILSQGEKRALYLLNIIYEIEILKQQNKEILIIADDIADSFDYQNKYAIVEYLKEISEFPKFYLVIMTHNYDFFRTLSTRLNHPKLLQAIRLSEEIKLKD